MAPGLSAGTEYSLAILVLIVVLVVRRTIRVMQGARYSTGRLFGFAAFAVIFFIGFAATTIYAALGSWGPVAWVLVAPYVATVVLVTLMAEPHVRRTVRFERGPDGAPLFRLPWLVPILYLVLFTARLAIEVVLFGVSSIFAPSVPTSLPTELLVVTIAFDLLYAVSVGLLFARGFGVRRAFLERGPPSADAKAIAPAAPPLP